MEHATRVPAQVTVSTVQTALADPSTATAYAPANGATVVVSKAGAAPALNTAGRRCASLAPANGLGFRTVRRQRRQAPSAAVVSAAAVVSSAAPAPARLLSRPHQATAATAPGPGVMPACALIAAPSASVRHHAPVPPATLVRHRRSPATAGMPCSTWTRPMVRYATLPVHTAIARRQHAQRFHTARYSNPAPHVSRARARAVTQVCVATAAVMTTARQVPAHATCTARPSPRHLFSIRLVGQRLVSMGVTPASAATPVTTVTALQRCVYMTPNFSARFELRIRLFTCGDTSQPII